MESAAQRQLTRVLGGVAVGSQIGVARQTGGAGLGASQCVSIRIELLEVARSFGPNVLRGQEQGGSQVLLHRRIVDL